jgi:DNA-binding winged helix-turn-helix (wHTH) protein/Tol biopolymer transport system component
MPQPQMTGVIRFGVFEVEPRSGILRKHGVRIRLQEQPFRVLLALLEKPGEVVTREELQRQVWTGTVFGDFEHSLNIAINKIREALGDSAGTPRFVETLPRRGYRFIAPVEAGVAPPPAKPVMPVKARLPKWVPVAVAGQAAVALIVGIAVWLLPSGPGELELRRLTNDHSPKAGPVLSDGARLYFRNGPAQEETQGRVADLQVRQVPVAGGEPSIVPFVPSSGRYFTLLDITPSGLELLLVTFENSIQPEAAPLWTLRIADGASRRVGSLLARQARYSPDGRWVAFTAGGILSPGSLSVASSDGSTVRRLLQLKGLSIVNPCWSPDGNRIVFGQFNQATQEASAWEVRADGTRLQRLFPDWRESHLPAGWTPEGRPLLISQFRFWTTGQPWLFHLGPSRLVPLSSGEPQFSGLLQLRDSRTSYAVGTTPLGELQRFDTKSGTWAPHLGGISVQCVEYSKNGQSLLYTTYPEVELWVRRADGSMPVRLTAAPMRVQMGRWSPDGRTIAFNGRSAPDQPLRMYLVDAAGGSLRPACPKGCGAADFTWAPDGKKIVFDDRFNASYTEENGLRLLDLGTGEVTKFPGSEGLYSPRWSPDGSALAAVVAPFRRGPEGKIQSLMLYRFSEGKWTELPDSPMQPSWPSWSHDSKSIWYVNRARGAIMRCHMRENRHEEMVPLRREDTTQGWFNLTPDDEPMILLRRDIQQVYALDWKVR